MNFFPEKEEKSEEKWKKSVQILYFAARGSGRGW